MSFSKQEIEIINLRLPLLFHIYSDSAVCFLWIIFENFSPIYSLQTPYHLQSSFLFEHKPDIINWEHYQNANKLLRSLYHSFICSNCARTPSRQSGPIFLYSPVRLRIVLLFSFICSERHT